MFLKFNQKNLKKLEKRKFRYNVNNIYVANYVQRFY